VSFQYLSKWIWNYSPSLSVAFEIYNWDIPQESLWIPAIRKQNKPPLTKEVALAIGPGKMYSAEFSGQMDQEEF
jgi:hypothetical protein